MKMKYMMTALATAALCACVGCSTTGEESGELPPEVEIITDESGATVTGARFEDVFEKVAGVVLAPVYFGFDSYALPPTEMSKVQAAIDLLTAHDNYVMVVEGNTDDRGSNEYNLSLGENRAQIIRSAIMEGGISGDRLQTRSFGEEKPAVAGSGEDIWKLNRRGEFSVYKK